MNRRRGSLFYKIMPVFIMLSVIPTALTGARLLSLNREILAAGGEGWALAPQAVDQVSGSLNAEMVSYVIYTVLVMGLLSIFASGTLIGPIRKLQEGVERFRRGELDHRLEIETGDEVEQLAQSFSQMARDLKRFQSQLEEKVTERTLDVERRAAQLRAAAEVGRAVATVRDLKQLLPQITRLVSTWFNYYHVGIFLLDADGKYLEMSASNSQGGRQMVNRGFRFDLDSDGPVVRAARERSPQVALDEGGDSVRFAYPELPQTRSEIGLPLLAGGKLLGVMDVQSRQPSAFSEEDVAVLQLLSDQVAVAIENARLFEENQAALEASRRAYAQLSRQAWEKVLQARPDVGYRVTTSDAVQSFSGDWSPEVLAASQNGEIVQADESTLAVPIKIREHVAGVIRLRKPEEDSDWTLEEVDLVETLTEQLSVALESARLYDETQRRAERERLAGEITAKVRATNDPQTILQTAVQELRQALHAKRAQVLLKTSGAGTTEAGAGEKGAA